MANDGTWPGWRIEGQPVKPWARQRKADCMHLGVDYSLSRLSTIVRCILKPAGDPGSTVKLFECVRARYTEQQVRHSFIGQKRRNLLD